MSQTDLAVPARFAESYTISFLVSFIAGFSDIFGFVALHELFTAHITGNLVIAISLIVLHIPGVRVKLLALLVFSITAIFLSALIHNVGLKRKWFCYFFITEAILYGLLMIIGLTILPSVIVNSKEYMVIAMLPVLAMTLHNVLMRTYLNKIPAYTVMTGNLTQFIIHLSEYLFTQKRQDHTEKSRMHAGIKKFFIPLLGFSLGGVIAAIGYCNIGFSVIIIEVIMMLLTALRAYQYRD